MVDNTGGGAGGAGGAGAGGAAGGTGGAGGGGDQPFYHAFGLDDDSRAFIAGKDFKTPADLVKSAMSADKLARERNVIPAPDLAKLNEWDGFEKLGWTKDPAAYKIESPKVPDGVPYDKGMEAAFIKAMHEQRVPPTQAKGMLDFMVGLLAKETEAKTAKGARELADLQTALRTEWGANYDANNDMAQRAARFLGIGLEDASQLEKITGSPGLLKMFQKMGALMGEDVLKGGSARSGGGMTPDQAQAEQNRLEADPEFLNSLRDPRHPQHKDNKARREQLIALKIGEKA